jgi:biopolymer transport protein TolR
VAGETVRRGKRRLMGEINVVPYIDVMLVLLIIFMVTAPLLSQGIKVELPQASAKNVDAKVERVILTIDGAGQKFLNVGDDQKRPLEDERVVTMVAAVLRNKPDTLVLVKAHKSLPYGDVVRAMSLLTQAGAPRVGLVTEPPKRGG